MTQNHRHRRSHAPRRGFTLLEVVIAALLIAVLMAAVYQVLFIYRKLFERGQSQTEEIQLIRTLSQQLSDDLAGAIQDPVFLGARTRSPSGARRFGLYGTSTELRIDVLQIPAFQVASAPAAQETEHTTEPRKLQAPELRTVYYTFHDSASVDSTLPDSRVGLTRRELDFETPEELDTAESGVPALAEVSLTEDTPVKPAAVVAAAPARSTFDELLEVGMDNSVMWAPEVMSLKFRYFDGSKWRNSWDSLARKGLPVAVEMTLAVVSLEQAEQTRTASSPTAAEPVTGSNLLAVVETPVAGDATADDETAGDESATGDTVSSDVALGETASSETVESQTPPAEAVLDAARRSNQPTLHMHRVVVHLPSSPLLKQRQPVKRQAAPTLEVPTLSTPAPLGKVIMQPAQPKTQTPRGAPDQWMRNE